MDLLSSLGQGLSTVGEGLDKFTGGRALRGLASGHPRELLSVLPFSDTAGITDEHEKQTGRNVTDYWGMTNKGDDDAGSSALGFGADMVLNPLALAGAGTAAIAAPTIAKGVGAAAKSLSGLDLMQSLGRGVGSAGHKVGGLLKGEEGAMNFGAFGARRPGSGIPGAMPSPVTPAEEAVNAATDVDRTWGLNSQGYTGTNAGALEGLRSPTQKRLLDFFHNDSGAAKVPVPERFRLASRGQTKAGRYWHEPEPHGTVIPDLGEAPGYDVGDIPIGDGNSLWGSRIPASPGGGYGLQGKGDAFAAFRSRMPAAKLAAVHTPPLDAAGLAGPLATPQSGPGLLDFFASESGGVVSDLPGALGRSARQGGHSLLDFLGDEAGAARIPTRSSIGRTPKAAAADSYGLADAKEAAAERAGANVEFGGKVERTGAKGYGLKGGPIPKSPKNIDVISQAPAHPWEPRRYPAKNATGDELVTAYEKLVGDARPDFAVGEYQLPPGIHDIEPEMRSLPDLLESAQLGVAARDTQEAQAAATPLGMMTHARFKNPLSLLKQFFGSEVAAAGSPSEVASLAAKGKMPPNPIDRSARSNPWLNAESRSMKPQRFSTDPAKKAWIAHHRTERTANPESLARQIARFAEDESGAAKPEAIRDSLLQWLPWANDARVSPEMRNAAAWAGPQYGGGEGKLRDILPKHGDSNNYPSLNSLLARLLGEGSAGVNKFAGLDRVAAEIPEGSSYLGHGIEAMALKTPDGGVVRLSPEATPLNPGGRADIPEILQPFRHLVLPAGSGPHQTPWRVEHLPLVNPVKQNEPKIRSILEAMSRAGHPDYRSTNLAVKNAIRRLDANADGLGWDMQRMLEANPEYAHLRFQDLHGGNVATTREGAAIAHDGGVAVPHDRFSPTQRYSPVPPTAADAWDASRAGGSEAVREARARALEHGTIGQGASHVPGADLLEILDDQKITRDFVEQYGRFLEGQIPESSPLLSPPPPDQNGSSWIRKVLSEARPELDSLGLPSGANFLHDAIRAAEANHASLASGWNPGSFNGSAGLLAMLGIGGATAGAYQGN